MWNSAFGIISLIFKAVWKTTAFTMNLIIDAVSSIASSLGFRSVERRNASLRGVAELTSGPQRVSELADSVGSAGKAVISGNDREYFSPWRDVVAARIVSRVVQSGTGVVVLHNGNEDLAARIQELVPAGELLIVDSAAPVHDPLRGLDVFESVELLTGSGIGDGYSMDGTCKVYLEGLIRLGRFTRKSNPSVAWLAKVSNLRLEKLQDTMAAKLGEGDKYETCNDLLVAGIAGRDRLRHFLNEAVRQLSDGLASPSLRERERISFDLAFEQKKVLLLDVRSVVNYPLGYGLLVNELNVANYRHHPGFLVLDGLEIAECDALLHKAIVRDSRLGVCLSMDDLFAKCKSKQERLNTLVSGSDCTVVFRHSSGDSAEAWQKTFGTYEKQELTTSTSSGGMRPSPFVLFPGHSSTASRIYTPKQEFRVKGSEIQNLEEGRVFITGAGSTEIRHCFLADE